MSLQKTPLFIVLLWLPLLALVPGAIGQETDTRPAPASAAANPLRSPASMMAYFETALLEERIPDAMRCLNFERIDPEVAKERGTEYVTQLAQILERLEFEGLYDRTKLQMTRRLSRRRSAVIRFC